MLQQLNPPKKAVGVDGISCKVIKELAGEISHCPIG